METKYYELTNPQKNIWLVDLVNKGNSINNISGVFYIDDKFDYDKHNETLNKLIEKNEGIRIKVITKDGEPLQYVDLFENQNIEMIDMTSSSKLELKKYIEKESSKPINVLEGDLYEFKIIKISENKTCIFYKFHHIISDAWGLIQVATQYSNIYENLNTRSSYELEVPSYVEYIKSEKQYMESEKYKKDEEFWNEYLKDTKSPVALKTVSKKISNDSKRYIAKLDKKLNEDINIYCKENKVSPYVLFMTALSTYVYRVKENNDFIIGTPVLNRSNFNEKQMLGMFVSTIPMRFKIEENMDFVDLARQISKDTMSIFRHQKYPYVKMLEETHSKTDIKTNLYNIILSYQNARANYSDNKKYNAIWLEPNHIQTDLDIHIVDINNEGKLEIYYDYLVDLFGKTEIKYLHTRLISIIEDAINNENVTVEDIRIMSLEEENKILYEFNNTDLNYKKDKTFIDLFEEQVEKTPDNVALVFENEKITYKELNEKANKIANNLIEKNVKTNDVIGIIMKRSIDVMVSILGVIKSGAAYLPIDSELPKDRIYYMFENSSTKFVIIHKNICKDLEIKSIDINDMIDGGNNNNPQIKIDMESAFYVLYTSGSTGKPKGIVVKHNNISNFMHHFLKHDVFEGCECFASLTTISFDIFAFETLASLLNGLRLVITNEEQQKIPYVFNELILKEKIDIIQTTPTRMKLLLNNIKDFENVKYIKKVVLAGEQLQLELRNKILKNGKIDIYNGYGPTETTIFSSFTKVTKQNKISIGTPFSNTKFYILDKRKRLLPLGVEGELYIAGEGVSKGYINKPDLNNKSFLNIYNESAYKSGDICKIDFDNNTYCYGRVDNQVKLKGLRIELDEISTCINSYKNIKNSIVAISKINNVDKIVAYYTCESEINVSDLKEHVELKLPRYMVPSVFFKIKNIYLNNNGKIDRIKTLEDSKHILQNYLENKESNNIKYEGVYKDIYLIFREVLQINKIGPNEVFFDIGGDSLLAIELVSKAMSKKLPITYADLYKYNTIKALGDMISNSFKKESISKEIETFDYKDINNLLQKNQFDNNIKQDYDLGNIFLTGATGFLGAHILASYLIKEKGIAYCSIREKNGVTGFERLKNRMKFFFGNKFENEFNKRIIVIEGDIEKDNIFDSTEISKKIIGNINTVINSAAHVKHFGDSETFENTNIHLVEKLIKFCLENNKRLIQISTLSVSGNILETGQVVQDNIEPNTIYNEDDFYIGQDLDNIYAYTKFIAEKLVLEAISNKGLDAKIMRMGNLTGRYYDGKFQPNVEENAFANRIKTILELNVMPENLLDFYLEFTPVDYASDAVVELSKYSKMCTVLHVFNDKHADMKFVNKTFKEIGINLNTISKKEMTKIIEENMKNSEKNNKIKGIILDINKNKELDYKPNTIIKSDFTIKLLEKAGFKWPEITKKYISIYINYLYNIGFLKRGDI